MHSRRRIQVSSVRNAALKENCEGERSLPATCLFGKETAVSRIAFQQALGKLVNDPAYGRAIEADSSVLTRDFDLTQAEQDVLGSVFQTAQGQDTEVEGHCFALCCYVS